MLINFTQKAMLLNREVIYVTKQSIQYIVMKIDASCHKDILS